MFSELNAVTYEAFGIIPEEFYKNKFNNVGHFDYFDLEVNHFHSGANRVRFMLQELPQGRVLDIGCGNGHYGTTLKKHANVEWLVGVDLDAECLKKAQEVYDETVLLAAHHELPFDSDSFDAVISCDFLGHVEFRDKDALLAEIQRVLKPGGKTIHVIESGFCDYLNCNPDDPEDPVRRYVHFDGHIGIEPPAAIKKRFAQFFTYVNVRNAMVFPCWDVSCLIGNGALFDPKLVEILKKFTPEEEQAANVVIGFINDYLVETVKKSNPAWLDPTCADTPLPEVFTRSSGLVFVTAIK